MTDHQSDTSQSPEQQQGEISAGVYAVGQNVQTAQIPSDAEDEPTEEEEDS